MELINWLQEQQFGEGSVLDAIFGLTIFVFIAGLIFFVLAVSDIHAVGAKDVAAISGMVMLTAPVAVVYFPLMVITLALYGLYTLYSVLLGDWNRR